jgi:hypothetical protein
MPGACSRISRVSARLSALRSPEQCLSLSTVRVCVGENKGEDDSDDEPPTEPYQDRTVKDVVAVPMIPLSKKRLLDKKTG